MRLLSIIHGPVYGGAHGQMIRLAPPLARRGYETIALVPDEGTGQARLREAGIETVTMPLHRLRATPNPAVQARFAASFRREAGAIRSLIRERSIDLVQVHGPTNPHGALAADREGAAVVWQIYDTVAPMWLRRLTMPLVVRKADSLTTWGMDLARTHPGALSLGERHVVVFPPVDTEEFAPNPGRRDAAREELGIPPDAVAVVSVGNRNPTKGLEWLVRSAARVRARRPDVVFRVLGAHSPPHAAYEEAVRREAAERGLGDAVDFEMLDAGTRVKELLPAFDVFALLSVPRSEGIPTVILEAMASGLPTVVTDVGAVVELVEDGATGYVVPPQNDAAQAEALLRVIEDAGLRERLGQAGRRTAVERYGLESLADRHARAFELALEHRRSRG